MFQQQQGQAPTLWLDKVSIDQNNIGDGLRVSPVNVMACTGMMVLCGQTYLGTLPSLVLRDIVTRMLFRFLMNMTPIMPRLLRVYC